MSTRNVPAVIRICPNNTVPLLDHLVREHLRIWSDDSRQPGSHVCSAKIDEERARTGRPRYARVPAANLARCSGRFQRTRRPAVERTERRRGRERIRRGLVSVFQAAGPAAFGLRAVEYVNGDLRNTIQLSGLRAKRPTAPAPVRTVVPFTQAAAMAESVIEQALDRAVSSKDDRRRWNAHAPGRTREADQFHGRSVSGGREGLDYRSVSIRRRAARRPNSGSAKIRRRRCGNGGKTSAGPTVSYGRCWPSSSSRSCLPPGGRLGTTTTRRFGQRSLCTSGHDRTTHRLAVA